ncbi:MAG: glycosyltransferase [Magnetococcus sp. DMHC-8]
MTDSPSPLLTIILTVYNMARFLPQCLESLTGEEADTTEILLIDDGSTDESAAMLAEQASRHARFRVVRQENQGLSVARNTGLAQARGLFVAFCDADDFVLPGYYTRLTAMAVAAGLDIALGNAMYHFEGRQPDYPIYRDDPGQQPTTGRAVLAFRLANKTLLHMVWMQVYRRAFVERHRLRFVPGIVHEDVIWTTRALLLAERVAYDPAPGYYYRQWKRERHYTDAALLKIMRSYEINTREVERLADGVEGDAHLQWWLRWRVADEGINILHKLARLTPAERRRQWRRLRQEGIFAVLWRNAMDWRLRRRIAKYYLKSWLAGGLAGRPG